MAELDGIWDVERSGGLLPPLVAVTKRIEGDRGETLVAGRFGIPFEVRGLELRYRGLLRGLVDVLEPEGDSGFRGRTTYREHNVGRFVMTRKEADVTNRAENAAAADSLGGRSFTQSDGRKKGA